MGNARARGGGAGRRHSFAFGRNSVMTKTHLPGKGRRGRIDLLKVLQQYPDQDE